MKSILIIAALVSTAYADDFADRWPAPVGTPDEPKLVISPPRHIEHTRRPRGFVCHRRHFMRHHHRYWRCQR